MRRGAAGQAGGSPPSMSADRMPATQNTRAAHRRVEVEADEVPDLSMNCGSGDGETLGQVRCEAERPPDPADGRLVEADRPRHRPGRPVVSLPAGLGSLVGAKVIA